MARCAATAAVTAAGALSNAAQKPSPAGFTTRPPAPSIASPDQPIVAGERGLHLVGMRLPQPALRDEAWGRVG
jgi:hypothetical protein